MALSSALKNEDTVEDVFPVGVFVLTEGFVATPADGPPLNTNIFLSNPKNKRLDWGGQELIELLERLLDLQETKNKGRKRQFLAHVVPTPMKDNKIKSYLSQMYKCTGAYVKQKCGKVSREGCDMFGGVPITKNNFLETIVF